MEAEKKVAQTYTTAELHVLSNEDKERLIKTMSRIKRRQYLEYLFDIFDANDQVRTNVKKHYNLPL